jgi:hypothetical protein
LNRTELLEKIIDRPALYVGKASVPLARAFIDGFDFGIGDDVSRTNDDLYSGFTDWVANRFGIKSSHGWSEIITFMGHSESGAFELLKELWSEYKKAKLA